MAHGASKVLNYLTTVRQLQPPVLKRYGVGCGFQKFVNDAGAWEEKLCVSFPWIKVTDEGAVVTRIKYRALESKGLQRLYPKGGAWGFFGWHTVRSSDNDAIIITEGEYDAMAVAQGLSYLPAEHPLRNIPVVSLPNGCHSLPTDLLPLLEPFKRVFLWLDNDSSGQEAVPKFISKIGRHRCHVIRPDPMLTNPPKDANDAIRMAPVTADPSTNIVANMVAAAEKPSHDRIETFSDLKNEVIRTFRAGAGAREGTQTPSIDGISALCKGFRRGELVLLTGPTGSGKTTLLSQLSVDFAKQGAPVLWGSFEIKNVRLVNHMLKQYNQHSGTLDRADPAAFQRVMEDFELLPIKFMNFHGSSDMEQIIEAMDFAVYRDDIQHIIIDNLQFMMPRKRGFDKFEQQDAVIDAMRQFATEKNVNVIMVIHPRKEDERFSLTMSSIYGSAKATQEADMVFILQRNAETGGMTLDLRKNRFDGHLGSVGLKFSPPRCSYYEVPLAPPTAAAPPRSSTSSYPAKKP